MNKKELSKVMSHLAKLSHKKSPRPRDFYVKMGSKPKKKLIHKIST